MPPVFGDALTEMALLLFVVGLKLNQHIIRILGPVASTFSNIIGWARCISRFFMTEKVTILSDHLRSQRISYGIGPWPNEKCQDG